MIAPLRRRAAAEFVGTAGLVCVVVGSGIAAERYSDDVGLQLLENALATTAGLAILILVLGPISGGHFNPVVTLVQCIEADAQSRLSAQDAAAYIGAQLAGALLGCVLANLMFSEPAVAWSSTARSGSGLWLAEIVATAGLLLVILSLARRRRDAETAWAVGAYIGAAYWFTSSTAFANPAVTAGRTITDTFTGIAPLSAPAFVMAQLVGAMLGLGLARALYREHQPTTDVIVVKEDA